MNSRERLLGIVVGAVAFLIVAYFAQSWVFAQFTTRKNQIAKLETDIKRFKLQAREGQAAAKKIAEYEERSLPPIPEKSNSFYYNWLLTQLDKADLGGPNVGIRTERNERDLYVQTTFSVDAQGTLPQVVDFLYAFYSVDWLHRITKLNLQPIRNDPKLLDVSITVEAISLRKAKDAEEMERRPSDRLKFGEWENYQEFIVGRNIFGPPNHPPQIASISGSKDVFLGRTAELTVKGTDPDEIDTVYYRILEGASSDAQIDNQSGKFTWTPKELGKFEFLVQAGDDGIPYRVSEPQKLVINVTEQPKTPPPPPGFDEAKFTALTGIVDIDGQGEVWLSIRTKGQTVKLHLGDQFEIGSIKGTVVEIGDYDFCFDAGGKRRKLELMGILEQASVAAEAPPAAAPAQTVAAEPPSE